MDKNSVRMRDVPLRNPALIELLTEFVDKFFEDDMDFIDKHIVARDHKEFHCTTLEYKNLLQSKPHVGYPEHAYLLTSAGLSDWGGGEGVIPEAKRLLLKEWQVKINSFIGAKYNALCAYYPADGYIGWHTNDNAPGYNILFVYNTTPDGYFIYEDPITKEIIKLHDTGGAWNVRVGYYGATPEKDKHLWHAAATKSPRVNIAFVLDQEEMWLDMIDEIGDAEA